MKVQSVLKYSKFMQNDASLHHIFGRISVQTLLPIMLAKPKATVHPLHTQPIRVEGPRANHLCIYRVFRFAPLPASWLHKVRIWLVRPLQGEGCSTPGGWGGGGGGRVMSLYRLNFVEFPHALHVFQYSLVISGNDNIPTCFACECNMKSDV